MAHLLAVHPDERLAIVFGRRGVEQIFLLLDRRELRVALIDDQVHQSVANRLIGNLRYPLPFLLTLEIADTGVGIATEDQTRIFEPFVQAATNSSRTGTGLGLAITKQLLESNGRKDRSGERSRPGIVFPGTAFGRAGEGIRRDTGWYSARTNGRSGFR